MALNGVDDNAPANMRQYIQQLERILLDYERRLKAAELQLANARRN